MRSLKRNETGAALVTAILILMLASGLMAGMFAALMATNRTHATDRDQSVAYAAAHAGLEKLTANLGTLFEIDFSPNATQIAAIDSTPPAIPGFTYTMPGGAAGSGYDITFTPDGAGNPQALANADITTGPFEGFKGLITKYDLTVTARSTTGNSEVRLRRELQTVAVPVFQFGIFGEKSLGFHAGPNFDFGGRVHTNESLFLANGDGNTLTFRDKITAVLQVVRNRLSNGNLISATNHEGTVSIPTIIGGLPATYRNLGVGESSGMITAPCVSPASTGTNCWSGWKNLSEVTYKANIRTEATGARRLDLPLTEDDAPPITLIRRPDVGSNENNLLPGLFGQRYFAQASLRILLSDRAADITGLPTITAAAPLQLDGAGPAGYVVGPGLPPIPQSPGPEPIVAATGASRTRVFAINGGPFPAASQLTFEFASAAGAFPAAAANPVPAWLEKPTILAGPGSNCPTFIGTQLSGCGNHPAFPAGTPVTFTKPDGSTFTINTASAAGLNSATINLAEPIGRRALFSSGFFVGEDPVVCTGWNSAQRLAGCTSPAGTTVAVNDRVYTGATTVAGTPLLNGFIKIEKQDLNGVWTDVTLEILNLGFADRNQQGDDCGDPTPDAVIRMMRLRDNAYPSDLCGNAAQPWTDYFDLNNPTDYWPNLLYDAREGNTRLQPLNTGMDMGGLMSYVAIDASNLRRWFAGTIGATGAQAWNNNGYIIYFSDRRGDHDETHPLVPDTETGEYGNEDFINQAAAAWVKNNVLDDGENVNESDNGADPPVPTIDMYGETPHALAVPAGAVANMQFDANQRPWTRVDLTYTGRGRLARPVLFRRALKIINAGIDGAGNNLLPASGVNFSAENPIYIQGNFNATAASVTAEPNVPAAVIGDSITLLSNAFRDTMTFQYPNDAANRDALTTGYRFAMVTGKTIPFPKPGGWGVAELGSDGGVHNFMKMLENWGGQTLRYRGSMVSLYYSRQAIGIYRADGNIYGPPTRGYNFDTDFLSPPLLPPGTPMFRDINTLKFRQILRPNQ